MTVIETQFEFTYEQKKYKANLSMFTPANTSMVRAYVHSNEFKDLVFVFYKIKKRELFWFELPDVWKQGMAEVIANKLLT